MLHAQQRPGATAIREKDLGIWQGWSWSQTLTEVYQIAAGRHQAGLRRGDHLAIIGENRPRLYFTMIAVQCLGGIPVPMYQDAVAAEMAFVFDNAEIKFAVVEDQEQVDKLLEVRETVPHLKRIVYEDPRGLRNYDQPGLASLRAAPHARRTVSGGTPGCRRRGNREGQRGRCRCDVLYVRHHRQSEGCGARATRACCRPAVPAPTMEG